MGDGAHKIAAVGQSYRAAAATWDGPREDAIFELLFNISATSATTPVVCRRSSRRSPGTKIGTPLTSCCPRRDKRAQTPPRRIRSAHHEEGARLANS